MTSNEAGARKRDLHVLLLAYFFPPLESAGFSIRAVKFLKYLSPRGWRFTVLAGDPERPRNPPQSSSSRFLLDEVPPEVRVVRVPAVRSVRLPIGDAAAPALGGVFAPLVDWVWMRHAWTAARRLHARDPVDVVLATAPPFVTCVLGHRVARALDRPLVLDFRDDWVDTPVFRAKPAWHRAIEGRMERRAIAAAAQVVTASEASLAHLRRRHPGLEAKLHHVPNGWDASEIPQAVEARPGVFTIATAGGYQRADRSPEPLFRAVGRLVRRRSEVARDLRIVLFGTWLHEEFSDEELASLGVAELVREERPVPKPELIEALAAAQLLVAIPTALWTRSIPGKLYEYWALGGPPILLIDDPLGAPADLVRRHALGTVVARGDAAAIESAIEAYYDAWAAGRPTRISREGSERFSRERLALELEAVLSQATRSPRRRAWGPGGPGRWG